MAHLSLHRVASAERSVQERYPEPSPLDALVRHLAFQAEPARGTVIGVTSAIDGEGKTTIARELARGLSDAATCDQPVLLVECGQPPRPQESRHVRDGLQGQSDVASASDLHYRSLQVLQVDGRPLHGATLQEGLATLRARHPFVVLDLPSLLGDLIAADLAREVDCLYLVVRCGYTKAEFLQAALTLLDRERLGGVILNDARPGLPHWLSRLVP